MSYIGNPIASTDFPVDYKSGNGSTTAFTLSIAPASVNSIDVQISGVSQSPQTYSVSGTTLTFSAAPPSGTNNIVVRHLGVAGIPNVPSAGSVVPSSIGTGYSLWNLSGSDINYTAGNVGIGTSSPGAKLDVGGNAKFTGVSTNAVSISTTNTNNSGYYTLNAYGTNGDGVTGWANSTVFESIPASGGNFALSAYGGTMIFQTGTGRTERMRIDSSGNLLVGTTVAQGNGTTIGTAGIKTYVPTTGYANHHIISSPNGDVGAIYSSGSTCVYANLSDYRVKENIAPMTGALNTVSKLKPCTYTWKTDGSNGQGFVAHELQAVVPDCVVGEKDAVDENGKPIYQHIDTSFLVATLTAAIQELKAELDATKAEVAALKAGA